MDETSTLPREARLLLGGMAHVARPEIDQRIFVSNEADDFGHVLLRLLQLGLEVKSPEREPPIPELEHVLADLGRLAPEILAADDFRAGVDLSLAGIRESDLGRIAEGFSMLSDFLGSQQRVPAALTYGYAAVFLDESSALCSWKLGRLKRRLGRKDAVAWYIRAVVLGEQQGEWELVVRCWLGVAWIAHERTHYRSALVYAGLALRVARDHRQKPLVPEALHYLAVLCFQLHQPVKGFVHTRDAVREYGDNRAKIALLANDVAQHVYSEAGQFARALPLFRAALREVTDPYEKLHIMASYARAAGGAGKEAELKWVIKHIYPLVNLAPEKLGVVEAFKDVARGAISAGLWDEARRAVEVAYAAASQRESKDASEIVPIDDELKALEKSVAEGRSNARPEDFTPLEDEVFDRIIHTLGTARIDALVRELLNDSRQRDRSTSLAIDCDPEDVKVVEELVSAVGGTLDATVRTLNGISVYASKIPVTKLASIVDHPVTQYVAVPDQYSLVD
jgi:tetratricopeptide (TPR) repeat protein